MCRFRLVGRTQISGEKTHKCWYGSSFLGHVTWNDGYINGTNRSNERYSTYMWNVALWVRRTRHAGHCWRSRDELISDVLLWTPSYGRAKAGRPARRYIQQLCEDTGCSPEDLPEAVNDWGEWRERVRDIRAGGTTWWWWWWTIPMMS